MTVDRDVIEVHEQASPDEVSRATVVAYAVAAALLVAWFLFGWLVLRQGFVDSVGESAGAGFALLLIISVVGTVRRSRR
ncbi:hypothetical protein ACTWLT_21735 [Micromonospora sp. ZYX-F-536]|uniref:hypothetical protein n=1 Tax=Micromonospora sp. ZYX-F-536 TaxID=3457629 RepID=UPI004040A052